MPDVVPFLRMILLKVVKEFITVYVMGNMESESQIISKSITSEKLILVYQRINPLLQHTNGLVRVIHTPVIRHLL